MSYYSTPSSYSSSSPYPYSYGKMTTNGNHVAAAEDEYTIPAPRKVDDGEKEGLWQFKAMLSLWLWYFFSTCTLFLNKHILVTMKGEPVLLSVVQMVVTVILGFVQMYVTCGMYKTVRRDSKPPNFYRNMTIVGSCRFVTVFLGLLALQYIAVSFTETVKSSAPIFTVLIAFLLTGEKTGFRTQLSLIPIMGGLALCSAYELSFSLFGFFAALSTNITECIQNVYSKLLISGEKYKYTPGEMQFYTAVASVVIIIPFSALIMDVNYAIESTDAHMMLVYLANGTFFHCQTMAAYVLMGYISPVTHSVANTVKRALMIWLSVLWFGNQVTFLSGLGTIVVTVGVTLYNKAREYDDSATASTGSAPAYSEQPALSKHRDPSVHNL